MNETLIKRAVSIVAHLEAPEAAAVLMESGVSAEDAYLAVMAAQHAADNGYAKGLLKLERDS